MQNTRAKNYTEWYQEVIAGADMAENSPVRGCMVAKPWGYGIWERLQSILDRRIKETGHENCYFPLFVPLSFFEKEAAHVDGFAKEMALVTHSRLKNSGGKLVLDGQLEEPLVVRPTSETIIADSFARWIQSYRDLPVLVNQWANVVRWEMRPRLFLRTTEFLWQEGHTAHSSAGEAMVETRKMLEVYKELAENAMAIPVLTGEKTAAERFPGAEDTFCIEAMMQDGKALQAGTSHFLGQTFAKAAGIKFQTKDGGVDHAYTTSWGVSWRLIGALIMTHGDDDGLRLPPAMAPSQVVIIPIIRSEEESAAVMAYCEKLRADLISRSALGEPVRVKLDSRDRKSQDKRWDWIKKGVPLIVEVGPRDIEKNQVCVVSRMEIGAKLFLDVKAFAEEVPGRLEEIQKALFAKAVEFRDANIRSDIHDFAALKAHFAPKNEFLAKGGPAFVRAKWCGDETSEAMLKDMAVTIRCLPFDQSGTKGTCVLTGKEATVDAIFARSY
ncbi:MAG: proline--tRNA ligase [candidate division FCPU426 bacterium]